MPETAIEIAGPVVEGCRTEVEAVAAVAASVDVSADELVVEEPPQEASPTTSTQKETRSKALIFRDPIIYSTEIEDWAGLKPRERYNVAMNNRQDVSECRRTAQSRAKSPHKAAVSE